MAAFIAVSASEFLELLRFTLRRSLNNSTFQTLVDEHAVPFPDSLPLLYLALAVLLATAGAWYLRQCCIMKSKATTVETVDDIRWVNLFNLAKTSYIRENKERLVYLIETHDININGHRDSATGLTLLLGACLSGDEDIVKFLLKKGADMTATTTQGDSALLLATHACCTVKTANSHILDLLACRGININAQNSNGDTALSIAALYGKTALISVLLQYGADPYISNFSGILAIDFAGCSGNFEAAKLLENHMKQALPL